MQHDWEKYFDTESEYWEKVQKIYKENDNYPKVVVHGRNLHHKFLRSFSRLEGTEIDNDKENLVSLSEGDHFLVHYYLWKCTKTGYKRQTSLAVHFMYKKSYKYITDEIVEMIAKEWKDSDLKGWHHSEETKKRLSKSHKGKPYNNKGKKASAETRKKLSDVHKGKPTWNKGLKLSEDTKAKMRVANKAKIQIIRNKYKEYKENGGTLIWNDFQKKMKIKI